MIIPRYIQNAIEAQLGKQKVVMLYGTRRTGKTTIIEHIAKKIPAEALVLQGEDHQVHAILKVSGLTAARATIRFTISGAHTMARKSTCLKSTARCRFRLLSANGEAASPEFRPLSKKRTPMPGMSRFISRTIWTGLHDLNHQDKQEPMSRRRVPTCSSKSS